MKWWQHTTMTQPMNAWDRFGITGVPAQKTTKKPLSIFKADGEGSSHSYKV